LDWLEGPGNKHIVRLRIGGTRHSDGSPQQPDDNNSEGVRAFGAARGTGNRAEMTAQQQQQ
jgi:hypothetical protein